MIKNFFKSIICLITSLVVLITSTITVSADTTIDYPYYNLVKDYGFKYGLPYDLANLKGFEEHNLGSKFFSTPTSGNNYFLITIVDNVNLGRISFYVYDTPTAPVLSKINNSNFQYQLVCSDYVRAFNCSFRDYGDTWSSSGTYSAPYVLPTDSSGQSYTYYVSTAYNYASDDTLIVSEAGIDAKKTTGNKLIDALKSGLTSLLTGGFDFSIFGSLLEPSLSANLSSSFKSLSDNFNDFLDISLSPTLDLGGLTFDITSDDYRSFITDLSKDTTNSAYWSNVDNSTANSIRQTYKNMQTCFDNSVTAWTDNSTGDYCYTANYDEDTTQDTYYNTDTYFNDYIRYDGGGSDTPDVTTTPGGGSSSGSGVGDIIISIDNSNGGITNENNNNISVGGSGTCTDNGTSSDYDDVDVSSLHSLLDSCNDFIEFVKNFISIFPDEFLVAFTALLTVVIACRVMGR